MSDGYHFFDSSRLASVHDAVPMRMRRFAGIALPARLALALPPPLPTFVARAVVRVALGALRPMLLFDGVARVVVGVLEAATVAHLPHQAGDGVAQVQRHRLIARRLDVAQRCTVR